MRQCQAGESAKNYRLGLDLGSNSIGWCAVTLDADGRPAGVLDAGVRILTPNDEAGRDPQSKTSLTASRRDARSMRTRRARFVRRRERLVETLAKAGLLPADRAQRDKLMADMDPYWLRGAALKQSLEPYEIGRAIFHLNQRRGFKSNRIADSGDKEKSAMKDGVKALEGKLEENSARTLGEMLAGMHGRDKQGKPANDGAPPQPVRFRPESQGNKNIWNFYPTREMIGEEIDKIWEKQREYHAELLTLQLRDRVKRIVIEQRPLKKPPVGRCTLMPDAGTISRFGFEIDMGERAPKAHPLFQRFRILQDVCQLRVRCQPGRPERFLTLRERDAIVAMLMNRAPQTIDFATLRCGAGLPPDARFNYESAGRNGFQTDHTAAKLASLRAFRRQWRSLPGERQVEIVERLLAEKDEGALCSWLQEECGLTEAAAEFVSAMRLPQGHGHLGRAALEGLVRVMEQESLEETDKETGEIYRRPLTYDEAAQRLGRHHSAHGPGERRSRLPYYGEAFPGSYVISRPNAPKGSQEFIGRVSNPTVHIGLNQLRKIVNALIDAYGPPREIVVELARELKLNKKQKEARERENRKNQERNDEIRRELAALGIADTHKNRRLLQLYGELPAGERVCVYSGGCISKGMLFGGEVEIDHILPYSRTLDDGFMNKALCIRKDNRSKGNRAPAEAWTGDELQEIAERAERLFKRKAWRFAPDAMQRFEENEGWLARQLNDTAYLSRMAKHYLEHVCGPGQVWVSPGRLTKMLRGRWGLNKLPADNGASGAGQEKNRNDHRHHAVDAFVIACTDRGLLKRIARESGRAEELHLDRLFPKDSFPQPFDDYYRRMTDRLQQLVVSHKPDHGIPPGGRDNPHVTSGALLEETAYGRVEKEISGKHYNLIYRKRVDELSRSEIERVADCRLRNDLKGVAGSVPPDDKKRLKEALAEFGGSRNIRRVRILKTEESFRIVRHGADGEFKKAYLPAGNHRIEIYEMPDGKWAGEGVTVYDANRPGFAPNWRNRHPEASLVMRVHKGDLIEADFGEGTAIYRVCRLEAKSSRLRLARHYEGGSLDERHKEKSDPFRYEMKAYSKLKAANARRVVVSPIGRVKPARDRP